MDVMETLTGAGRTASEVRKVWLAGGGVALAAAWRFLPPRVARGLLVVFTIVSALSYGRWDPELLTEKLDPYDLLHYYVNAKYFDELGYLDLYPAVMLADHEQNGPYFDEGSKYMAQDESGHSFKPIEHAIARGREVKATKFTPERWQEFTHDALYVQRNVKGLNDELWRQLIQDHGFNGTTVWTMVARPFAEIVPVEHIKWLALIDVALLAAGVGALAWAYGADVAMWAAFFLFITYSARWPTISWAFLRYDWVAALMVAMACLKKGRPLLAGILTGYAATLRLFPALWLYGPGAKGFAGLAGKKVHKQLLVLLAGFALSAGVLQGLAAVDLGVDTVKTHFENMEDHNSSEQLSSRRIGLALALPFKGDLEPKYITREMKATIEDQKPLRFAVAGVILLLLGWGLRTARDDEAFAFGFLPFFLLTTASYYYYVARVTLVILHASDLKKPRHLFGLVWLLGLEGFTNWSETHHVDHRVYLIGMLAWGLTIYGGVMALWYLWDSRKGLSAESSG